MEFITAKRNVPLAGRSYGHWWTELDDEESYGWWPGATSVGLITAIRGTTGVLNGLGATTGGSPTRDPSHGLIADYEFHPLLLIPRTDDELRIAMRRFASTFTGGWRWSTRPTMNCRLFQLAMFDEVGLVDGTGNYHSRGRGCPALAPARRWAGRATGRRRWATNMPEPGQHVADVLESPELVVAVRPADDAQIARCDAQTPTWQLATRGLR